MKPNPHEPSPKDLLKPWAFVNSPGIHTGSSTPGWLLTANLYFKDSPNAQRYEQVCFSDYLVVHGSHDSHILPCPSS